jgi:hypothetical protein
MINLLPKVKPETKLLPSRNLFQMPLQTTFPVFLTNPLLFMFRTILTAKVRIFFIPHIFLIQTLSEPLVTSVRRNASDQMKFLILL